MVLKRLDLTNFRIFDVINLEFADGINLLTGRNGCGKTSILESIYFLSLTKSFRTSQDIQIIKHKTDYFSITGYLNTESESMKVSRIYYSEKEGKHMFLDNKEISRYSDYIGMIPCVLLQPDDIKLTLGAPVDRRKFLDILLSQVSPVYLEDLKLYKRVLIQRNALLSSEDDRNINHQLEVWNRQLVEHGSRIIKKRLEFIGFLDTQLESYYNDFSEKEDSIHVEYHSSILGNKKDVTVYEIQNLFTKKISMLFKYELYKRSTAAGPHRDDVFFYKNGKFFKDFASQGENKSLIIALKLLEWKYLSQTHVTRPVLLFDDIFGELDQTRMTGLLRFLNNVGQTFITTTLAEKFSAELMNKEIRLEEMVPGNAWK